MRNRSLLGLVFTAHVSAHAAGSAGVGNFPFDAAVTGLASTFANIALSVVCRRDSGDIPLMDRCRDES